jgi:hypothetical protein
MQGREIADPGDRVILPADGEESAATSLDFATRPRAGRLSGMVSPRTSFNSPEASSEISPMSAAAAATPLRTISVRLIAPRDTPLDSRWSRSHATRR